MRSIAEEAGVAEKTLYLVFRSKAALLDAVIDAAIRGPGQPAVASSGPEESAPRAPAEFLQSFSEEAAKIMERTARVLEMAEAAATIDPDLAVHRKRGHEAMRQRFDGVAAELAAGGALADQVSKREAAATIYALANHSVYLRLIDGYGWKTADYARWLEDVLIRKLTESSPAPSTHKRR
jgi:AcrR family transcriptional regulator